MSRRRAPLWWGFGLLLAGFHLTVGWQALHPAVSDEYRLYYIEQRLKYLPNPALTPGRASLDVGFDEAVAFTHPVPFLSRDWSAPRPWGVWSRGTKGSLMLRLPAGRDGDVEVELTIRAAVFAAHPRQRVEVRAAGAPVAAWDLRHGDVPDRLRFTVPRDRIGADRLLVLEFAFPDAVNPYRLGVSDDDRWRAIGLERLVIRRPA